MTKAGLSKHDNTKRYDAFNHTGEGIDPGILAVPPADPFTLLAPGMVIAEGDIKRLVGDGNRWVSIEEREEGHKAPTRGTAYARATAPAGYVLMSGTDRVSPSCLIWTSGTGDWRGAAEHGVEEETTVSNLASLYGKERNQLFFAAKPIPGKENHRFAGLPSRHRELFPGEKLRTLDRMIHEGLTEWILVSMLSLGQPVASPNISNGHVRFCRLVHPNHQNWYVDTVNGKDSHLGGSSDPWPSLEVATEKIEAAARMAQTAPYGIIWTCQGIPLMVYDMPSQPSQRSMSQDSIDAMMAAANAPVVSEQKPAKSGRVKDDVTWIANSLNCTEEDVISDATTNLPKGYRLMIAGEEVKPGDMQYRPLTAEDYESLYWQPVAEGIMGVDPGEVRYVLARRGLVGKSKADDRCQSPATA